MLKDITIGQFFPGDSFVHRLDPRFKIVFTIAFIAMLFIADSFAGLGMGIVFVLVAFLASKIPFIMMLKSLKPILPIIVFTSVLNIFFIRTGDVVIHWAFIIITKQGLSTAGFMVIRIVALIIGSSLLTYTTSPIVLTDAIERLLSPLKIFKVPVHALAMMMNIALRFIPTLIEETDKIISAQKARGSDMESGNLIQKAKSLVPVIVPLFISSFRRAEELALAMECRCYHGGDGRTRMKQLKCSYRDFLTIVILAGFIAVVVVFNILGI